MDPRDFWREHSARHASTNSLRGVSFASQKALVDLLFPVFMTS